ncbi:MAG: UDP-N-acetylmuramate dehydrogenase [Ruminococcaceae bacterium]|nr:UDP-N-acetylmuramate dehydrogenase [Oscillospiraceae bacterium]
MEKLLLQLRQLNIDVRTDMPLFSLSSFRIGGNADLAVFPRTREEFIKALSVLHKADVPTVVVGNATNVVFPDEGYRGVVLFTTSVLDCTASGCVIDVGAGVPISFIATMAKNASLCGAEFAYGIPGSVGGAVFMNAGAFGGAMSDICVRSEYFDMESGVCGVLEGTAQRFGYRTSAYEHSPNLIILGARVVLKPGEKDEIATLMREIMERRRSTQPLEYPSAGSVFKRPEGHFAGKLIEDCGLKGTRIGGAEVSTKHAGFIVNRGGATAGDVRALVEKIRETVLKETGVTLECEIRFL